MSLFDLTLLSIGFIGLLLSGILVLKKNDSLGIGMVTIGMVGVVFVGFLGFGVYASIGEFYYKVEPVNTIITKSPTTVYVESDIISGKFITKKDYDIITDTTQFYVINIYNLYKNCKKNIIIYEDKLKRFNFDEMTKLKNK